jgi:hypothetical protein
MVRLIFWIQQAWKHLNLMDIGWYDSISADEPIVDIDADNVLVTIVTDAVLFCLASI